MPVEKAGISEKTSPEQTPDLAMQLCGFRNGEFRKLSLVYGFGIMRRLKVFTLVSILAVINQFFKTPHLHVYIYRSRIFNVPPEQILCGSLMFPGATCPVKHHSLQPLALIS